MISREIKSLVVEVAGAVGERERQKATKDPELCLVAMLQFIKKRLNNPSAMLKSTIESSFFDGYQEEARQLLRGGHPKKRQQS